MESLLCGIKKKWYKWTYLQNRNRVTDREKKFMATKMKERGGINWEIGVNKYARMKQMTIDNKNLLYSIGNSIQYSVMTQTAKEAKKECV